MSDPQAAALSGIAGIVAQKLGFLNLVIQISGVPDWVNTLATGAVAAIGGVIVTEGWKHLKNALKKNPNKPKQ